MATAFSTVNVHDVTNVVTSKKKRFKFFLEGRGDLEVERRAGGRLFHARVPATANARSPIDARDESDDDDDDEHIP